MICEILKKVYVGGCWFLIVLCLNSGSFAADDALLILGDAGSSEYQIVLADESDSPLIGEWLIQIGRLLQTAFAVNGIDLPIVSETDRDIARPGIFLGNSVYARSVGVEVTRLEGWSYVHKVVGRNLIIAGHDHESPPTGGSQHPRLGTAKGVVDFLSRHAGARFLYPEVTFNLAPQANPTAIGRLDFGACAEYEFIPTATISVPADLNLIFTPFVAHGVGRGRISFYELAANKYPQIDETTVGHVWEKAVPASEYAASNPEYFALIDGRRVPDEQFPQYCLSNPGFQELVYSWIIRRVEQGLNGTLLQASGFAPCQCEDCYNLYDTGDDWNEKIWRFNLKMAERLEQDFPDARLFLSNFLSNFSNSETLVSDPPKTFTAFPKNVTMQLVCPDRKDLAAWQGISIPGGIKVEIHNWSVFRRGGRVNHGAYTPMRTPVFIARQAELFHRYDIQTAFLDGAPYVYGLEGPVHYAWGRLLDDPAANRAAELVSEFVEAAFGESVSPMLRFYDRLYHGIELYANFLGVDNPAKKYIDIYGRRRRYIEDPLQLLGFLYTPDLLESLERELAAAEGLASGEKVKIRLAQVRLEFDWVRDIARVIHIYNAHRLLPECAALRDRLLEAIDKRNARIDGLYPGGRIRPQKGWSGGHPFFPIHNLNHTRLGINPFVDTPLNWDTSAMRREAAVEP